MDVNSQIKIDFSMVLNLLLSHTPPQIHELLEKSFASYLISLGKQGRQARKEYGYGLKYLWQDFLAHLDFLKEEGFVTPEGTLTEDGEWTSQFAHGSASYGGPVSPPGAVARPGPCDAGGGDGSLCQ